MMYVIYNHVGIICSVFCEQYRLGEACSHKANLQACAAKATEAHQVQGSSYVERKVIKVYN